MFSRSTSVLDFRLARESLSSPSTWLLFTPPVSILFLKKVTAVDITTETIQATPGGEMIDRETEMTTGKGIVKRRGTTMGVTGVEEDALVVIRETEIESAQAIGDKVPTTVRSGPMNPLM